MESAADRQPPPLAQTSIPNYTNIHHINDNSGVNTILDKDSWFTYLGFLYRFTISCGGARLQVFDIHPWAMD